MSLKGKTLFITGASRGIGLAIGLRAARDGANVALLAKTAEPNPNAKVVIVLGGGRTCGDEEAAPASRRAFMSVETSGQ